jgi:hypothetical protein
MAAGFASGCVGRIERVIAEREGGLSDRYLRTRMKKCPARPGEMVMVRIVENSGAELLGEAVPGREAETAFPVSRAASGRP